MYRRYLKEIGANKGDGASLKLDKREQSKLHRELSIAKKLNEKKTNDSLTHHVSNSKDGVNLQSNDTNLNPADQQSLNLKLASTKDDPLTDNLKDVDPEILSICRGCMDHKLPNLSKLIRIFTSSTFTDTKVERNSLMEHVYPRLKEKCQELGYEFQVVDMRWGVRDEAVDDHRSTELCLREIDLCQKLSAGPTFVTFLSHKYGFRPFPRVITESEFDEIMRRTTNEEERNLVLKWFKKDENFVPAAYVLQPISAHYPDFLNKAEPEKRDAAKNAFWKDSDDIQAILVNAATKFLSGDEADKYLASVTEMEIQMGILKEPSTHSRCLWFKRNILDIEEQAPSRMLGRFYECKGSTEAVVREARGLLKVLKEEKIPSKLPKDSILEYNVRWHPEGIVPDKVEEHAAYIKKLCEDFELRIIRLVNQHIEERSKSVVQEPLVQEIVQHLGFCAEKCKHFYGRRELLDVIRGYVLSENDNRPLVIHGASGCGKTSVMAMAARQARDWLGGDACVVLRFLGTTQDSSNIESLLWSILHQLYRYNLLRPPAIPKTFKQLSRFFATRLPALCHQKRVVLFLDSIDQLDVDLGARLCQWLPLDLNLGLRVVISTLPEKKYEVMPSLRAIIKDDAAFVSVPSLSLSDVSRILSSWLGGAHRALTEEQFRFVVSAFNDCQLPLFLKLCFDQGCTWPSYSKPSLAEDVRSMISLLFSNLERDHGKILVSRALGYLTLCSSGLSEGELEDILSLDDVVLNDTYQFWTPPLRRLPPLLLARIRFTLAEYLVERGSDSVRVLVWYHRQFIEAAQDRYCADEALREEMHGVVAEYYLGVWAGTPKPFEDKRGNAGSALRHVAAQPYRFSNSKFNIRKLMQLPEHLMKSKQVEKLKSECLFNFEFLFSKLSGKSVRALLVDAQTARETFPGDPEIELLCEVLQLAQGALSYESSTLAGQLFGFLSQQTSVGPHVQNLVDSCSRPIVPSFICNRPILPQPGGQLTHVLTAHSKDTTWLSLSASGNLAVTCSDDRSVRIWDLQAAVMLRTIDHAWTELTEVFFVREDQYVLAAHNTGVAVVNVKTGVVETEIPHFKKGGHFSVLVLDHGNIFAFPFGEKLYVYGTDDWNQKFVIKKWTNNEGRSDYYSNYSPTAGRKRYVAVTPGTEDHFLDLFDLEEKRFLQHYEAFPPMDEDDDDADDFCVNGVGFNSDESMIFFYTCLDCDIHIHLFPSMNPFKIIKGSKSMNLEKCYISNDDKFLYTVNRNSVVRFDLEKDIFEVVLQNETSLKECLVRSHMDLVTLDVDNALRIWDLRRTAHAQNITVVKDVDFRKGVEWQLFAGDRYLFQTLSCTMKTDTAKAKDKDHSSVCIYDVVEQKLVHKTRFYNNMKASLHTVFIDEKRVLLHLGRKLFLFDLEKQEITVDFEGVTAKYIFNFPVCLERNEMWTPTRNAKRLKCYDIRTGKVTKLAKFPLGRKERYIDGVTIVPDGSLVLATDDEADVVYGFNPDTCEQVLKLFYHKDSYFSLSDFKFAMNNTFAVCTLELKVIREDITSLAVFSLPKQGLLHLCFDKKSQLRNLLKKKRGLAKSDEELDMNVYCYQVVADRFAVTGSMDAVIRLWDLVTGVLLRHLLGHTQDISEIFVSSDPKSLFFATSSNSEGENAVRVWHLKKAASVGTYKMHVEARDYCVLGNGKMVLGHYNSMEDPVHFTYADENGLFKFQGPSALPWMESGDMEKGINIELPKVYELIPNDMDSDEDAKSTDDEDEDEDDDDDDDDN